VRGLGENPQLAATGTINGLDLARLAAAVNHRGRVSGRLHASITLTTDGAKRQAMLRRLNGTVAMHGTDLTIENIDLDTILTQYAKSQEIGLLDLGSIFIVGPFGPLLSKALDLSGAALGVGRGKSRITMLVSDWTIRNGMACAADVALATPKHRLAFTGRLDLPAGRFLDFRVGILDPRGCATFTQRVNGSFQEPQIEKASLLAGTLVAPLVSLFRKGMTALGGEQPACTPFYRGRVPHPATP
jgi:AsmA protein